MSLYMALQLWMNQEIGLLLTWLIDWYKWAHENVIAAIAATKHSDSPCSRVQLSIRVHEMHRLGQPGRSDAEAESPDLSVSEWLCHALASTPAACTGCPLSHTSREAERTMEERCSLSQTGCSYHHTTPTEIYSPVWWQSNSSKPISEKNPQSFFHKITFLAVRTCPRSSS